jgi:hypothetical protein
LSKTNKKPGTWPGPVQLQIHSDPQHATPQMTRLVILPISCLKVRCISLNLELRSNSLFLDVQVTDLSCTPDSLQVERAG